MFFCSISGEPPQDPVVSAKSGHVYERRLIQKYLAENGTDPADLITIKANPQAAAPRPPTATSIPALLHTLQNEWDAAMLETFALKQKYNSVRQELSYSLYAQDAATRVVARLLRERDAAREALGSVSATMGVAPTTNGGGDVEMDDAAQDGGVIPADALKQIDDTFATLSAARKKRKPPRDHTFTAKHTIPSLHSASPAGINALAVSRANPTQFVTGGNDKVVQLYDRATDKVLASLKGHTKKRDGDPTLVLSAGADKVARVWAHDAASGEYVPRATIRTHKGEITGLAVHPTSTIVTLASTDRTYSLHDIMSGTLLFRAPPADEPFTALDVHPDGTLIYDVRSGNIAAVLTPPAGTPFTVNTLSFSENGYHLLAPDALSSLAVWDLRKQKISHSIPLGEGFRVHKVLYDVSAQLLGVAGSEGARVYAHKSWEELVRFEEGGEVTDMAYGESGKEIWGASGREVRIWGLPE
ncbi:nuclear matrix protein NMP200 [Amylocystis lapponica]|nr:nuclear matrix protein NMP200 [Amylocystis lapponica]